MISLEEAQTRLLELAAPVAGEQVDLIDAVDRWLAETVTARRTQPARNLSAMDGYAIRFADLPGPWRVTGESAAGRMFAGSVAPGEAVRIFTGAVVPAGADTVIVQEDVAADGEKLTLTGDGPPAIGAHIRLQGSDFTTGQTLIDAGTRLNPAHIGLAAMAGYAALPVSRKLRIAIISTGDELVAPGAPTGPDQIPSSNAPMLSALLARFPVEIDARGIIADDLGKLTEQFTTAIQYDVIITLGGASVGDHDLVQPALSAAGARLDFWKIAMRPGKPVMAGRLGDAIVLGLPGNPVSAYVTAILFLLPLIAHMSGAPDPLPMRTTARLGAPLPANGPRTDHVRARLSGGVVTATGPNDSAVLGALAASTALIIRPPGAKPAEIGATVDVMTLP